MTEQTKEVQQVISAIWDKDIQVDKIIWLGGNVARMCDDLKELMETHVEIFQEFFSRTPPETDKRRPLEEFLEYLIHAGFTGYLARVYTPFNRGSGNWGMQSSRWFYLPQWSEEALVKEATEWVNANNLNSHAD